MLRGQRTAYNCSSRQSRVDVCFPLLAEFLRQSQAWGDLGGLWAGGWEVPGGVRLYKPAGARITPLRSWHQVPHTPQPRGCRRKGCLAYLVNELPEHNLNCEKQQFSLLLIFCDFIYLLSYFSPTSF